NQSGVGLLRIDDGLLHILMNRSFNGAHEPSSHVYTLSPKGQRGGQPVPIRESTRCKKRYLEFLSGSTQKNEIGNISLPNVTGTLEAVY
ncbi:hypothetical protein Plec18170_003228, partial [Paecilomyces lecythidis]